MLGYKVLDANACNQYGKRFLVGQTYTCDGEIRFGPSGNGYHFCRQFEDTFRFFDHFTASFLLASVEASGSIKDGYDRYGDMDEIYVAQTIKVLSYLTKQEIFVMGMQLIPMRMKHFVQYYPFNEEEKKIFLAEYPLTLEIVQMFDYYQNHNLKAFENPWNYLENTKKGVVLSKKWR